MRLSAATAAASTTAEERPGAETPPGLRFGATAQLWAGHAGAASDRRLAVVLVVYRFTSRFSGVGPRKPGFIVISPPGAGACGSFEKSHDPFPLPGPHENRFRR